MNESTVRLSADTSARTDSLSKIAEEMTAMKDNVSSSAEAIGSILDASAKQAEAANAAFDLLTTDYDISDKLPAHAFLQFFFSAKADSDY